MNTSFYRFSPPNGSAWIMKALLGNAFKRRINKVMYSWRFRGLDKIRGFSDVNATK